MFILERELQQLVGKLIEYKLEITKDNDINLSRDTKKILLPWAEQLQDEAQELVNLLKKGWRLEDNNGHRIDKAGNRIKDELCGVCKHDNSTIS